MKTLQIRYGRRDGTGYAWTEGEGENAVYGVHKRAGDDRYDGDWSRQNEALGILIGEVSDTIRFGMDHRPISVDTEDVPDWVVEQDAVNSAP